MKRITRHLKSKIINGIKIKRINLKKLIYTLRKIDVNTIFKIIF